MYPLLVFATGVLAGAAGVRLLKGAKGPLKATGEQATGAVRGAAVSGLSALERTSACLRTKLAPAPVAEAAAEPAAEATAEETAPAGETAEQPWPEGKAP